MTPHDAAAAKAEARLEAHLEHVRGVCGGDCPECNRAFARWRFAQADPKDRA